MRGLFRCPGARAGGAQGGGPAVCLGWHVVPEQPANWLTVLKKFNCVEREKNQPELRKLKTKCFANLWFWMRMTFNLSANNCKE
ncbi:hypothetical protein Y1Q_0013699 [Alligator mississippiensis]|uniref:Uncharacterized protein n=1 Tax=Alligator mississippiensis TaxID=8496 RepID=A0A151P3S3_ALLMI|nr:hypothetical protein Y1Q_0013699 [Alligator mississippiensis]